MVGDERAMIYHMIQVVKHISIISTAAGTVPSYLKSWKLSRYIINKTKIHSIHPEVFHCCTS